MLCGVGNLKLLTEVGIHKHTISQCHTHTHLQQLGVMLCGVGNLELLTEVGIHKQLDALKVASVALHDEELILHDTCTQQGFSSCKSG